MKSQIRRLLSIVNFLSQTVPKSTRDLSELLGVSRRTVLRDISTLRKAGCEILNSNENRGYTSSLRFRKSLDIPYDEWVLLHFQLQVMGTMFALTNKQVAAQVWHGLLELAPINKRDFIESISIKFALSDIPTTSQLTELKSLPVFTQTIIPAILRQLKTRISTHEFQTLIQPYAAYFDNTSWVIVARSSFHKRKIEIDARDINYAETTTDNFTTPSNFSLKHHIGIMKHTKMITQRIA